LKTTNSLIVALFGSISTIPYELSTRFLISLGIGKYSVYHLTSLIVTLNRPKTFMGIVICFVISALFSLVFLYILKKLGFDYLIIKSIIFSLFIWINMETLFVWLIEGPKLIQPRPISDYYLHMFGSLIFGITQGLLYKKYLSFVKTN
jgi:ABC-type branched-subunit amino acid transport system permease subunit